MVVGRQCSNARKRKRPKLQQSIRSMFRRTGPKFVEAVGVQIVCKYCNRKLKAPQGLAAHIHMHERAGDAILCERQEEEIQSDMPAPLSAPADEGKVNVDPVFAVENDSVQPDSKSDRAEILSPSRKLMTRRFTIAEKLRIIDKFKECDNVSITCRWVKAEFRRSTFDRKSLRTMVSRESIFRKSIGTKKIRKTVRVGTGSFHRMDKALAK